MNDTDETKVIYHIDEEDTPYLIKLPISSDAVVLNDLKTALGKPTYKYFFKSMDDDFGVVKEEIIDDSCKLPCFNGRVICWLVAADGSHGSVSDGGSNCGSEPVSDYDGRAPYNGRPLQHPDDLSTESESIVCNRRGRMNGHSFLPGYRGGPPDRGYESSTTMMSSEFDTTSFFETDDDSRFTQTDRSSVASRFMKRQRRRPRKRPLNRKMDRASSFSSITDSTMSLNIITVTLSMDNTSFLGISIVGTTHKQGDGGIYVGTIMPGGAVAQDGRIEPGDMILQVNDVSFENMANDDAVTVLRDVVNRPGPVKLVVAKCWNPNPRSFFTLPKNDPIRPIDPSSWLEASRMANRNNGPTSPQYGSAPSETSSQFTSIPDSERPLIYPPIPGAERGEANNAYHATNIPPPPPGLNVSDSNLDKLTVNSDIHAIIRAMQQPGFGLEIKDRMWLKITIPNAFLGHNLVDWLFDHLDGFPDRREARRFANKMLKDGLIRHTTGKLNFSEQCYYVFNQDYLISQVNNLSINDPSEAAEEQDRLAPLPLYGTPWMPPQYTGYQPRTAGYQAQMGELEMFGPGSAPREGNSGGSGHSSPGSSSDRSSKELVKTEFL
uniref:Dishevelled-1 n=1 Tax=Hofstenia miamia TaxID=442651 RepID=A0A068CJW0_HOFMI|nr:dishevelled-1 [Hofstenia miamia]